MGGFGEGVDGVFAFQGVAGKLGAVEVGEHKEASEFAISENEVSWEQIEVEEEHLLEGEVAAFHGGFSWGAGVGKDVFEAQAVDGRLEFPGDPGSLESGTTHGKGEGRFEVSAVRGNGKNVSKNDWRHWPVRREARLDGAKPAPVVSARAPERRTAADRRPPR